MSGRSTIGWLILVAGLAVPAVLFWKWREQMKTQGISEAQSTASSGAFAGVSSAGALSNPMDAAPSTGTVQAAASEPAAQAAPAAELAASSSATAAVPVAAAAKEEGIMFRPKTDRDPTLSPEDRKKLLDEMLARQNAPQVEEPERPRRPRPRPLESRIKLYGIVATPNGITALINDRVVKPGDQIEGAVVERITTKMVVFKHRNRTFTMRLSK